MSNTGIAHGEDGFGDKIEDDSGREPQTLGEMENTSIAENNPISFNASLLPQRVAPFVIDVASRMNNAPISFAGTTAIAFLSGAIGRRVGVRPKLQDDWTVIPNLWGMLIAPPSIKKTPIYTEFAKALKRVEAIERKKYKKEKRIHSVAMEDYNIERTAYNKAKKDQKGGEEKKLEISQPTQPENPKDVRYLISDATIEKVADIMTDNTNGLMLTLDELSGWFATLSKSGREGDRSFWLEAFNGNSSKHIDRIARGSSFVPHVCASIFGTIQPDVVSDVILKTNSGTSGGDGLMQRFQLMVMETRSAWRYVDRTPNSTARDEYYDLIENLLKADPLQYGAKQDTYNKETIYYRFSKGANEIFIDFCTSLNSKVNDEEEHNPALSAHLGKYEAFFASLALILFYSDRVSGVTMDNTIPMEYAIKAKELCIFYEEQARQVYNIEDLKEKQKEKLTEKILDKVSELEKRGELPLTYSVISQRIAGANAKAVEDATKDLVIVEGRKIIGLKK